MNSDLLIISLIQGIGEILPISSSVNMFFFSRLLEIPLFSFSFKIALHAGSLIAIVVYYHKEIFDILHSVFSEKKQIKDTYFWQLVVGTVPVVILGYFARDFVKEFDSHTIMGVLCIAFGILLYAIDKISCSARRIDSRTNNISIAKSFIIGVFQSISIFPGVSRLGICITAGRMLNFDRKKAIVFSLLLAIPSLFASLCLEIYNAGLSSFSSQEFLLGIGLTAVIGVIAIGPCVQFMKRCGFFAIAIFRCVLGIFVLFT